MPSTERVTQPKTIRRPRYSDTRAAAIAQALTEYDMPRTLVGATRTATAR